jgi:hypothetical protein
MKSYLLAFILLFPLLALKNFASALEIGHGKTYANLAEAAPFAEAGDTLLFAAGTYSGGQSVAGLKGVKNTWIVIKAASPGEVVIRGGTNAWQLSDPAFVNISGFIFERQTGNGVNVDDGGTFATPALHVIFENCVFRDMNASGNNDLLKLSGVDSFQVKNCRFENGAGGGSGIDMVGCHHGEIVNNRFENMGSNAIQAKGGTQFIHIQANWFENCGQRSVNLGGSTGLAFFRPQDAPFEAADLHVYANIFIGSIAPIAYVGCIRTEVINNTIIQPGKWVVRILQETVDENRFAACGDNSFRNNLVYLSTLSTEANIGPNTRPQSFEFSSNFWYNLENQNWSGPNIPVNDPNQIINKNPDFRDINNSDFALQPNSSAIGVSDYAGDPRSDYAGAVYNSPRSVGALEGNPVTGLNEKTEAKSEIYCVVHPNPFNRVSVFLYRPRFAASTTLSIFDLTGRTIVNLNAAAEGTGERQIVYDFGNAPSGIYFYQLQNGPDIVCGKMTLLR